MFLSRQDLSRNYIKLKSNELIFLKKMLTYNLFDCKELFILKIHLIKALLINFHLLKAGPLIFLAHPFIILLINLFLYFQLIRLLRLYLQKILFQSLYLINS